MMHFSCDLCGKMIHSEDDQRYIIKIESHAAQDPVQITDADLDEDHLVEIGQLLSEMEEHEESGDVDQAHRFRFDLCPDCHKRFVRDPLGKEQGHKLFFSKN